MTGEDDMLDVVGRIYDAGLDAGRWPGVLERIGTAVCASGALLFAPNFRNEHAALFALEGLDPSEVARYSRDFVPYDIWAKASRAHPIGTVVSDGLFQLETSLDHSVFYQDFLRNNDIYHFMGPILDRHEGTNVHLSFYRSRRAGPFDAMDREVLRRLAPHLRRALEAHRRVGTLENRIAAATVAFDQLSTAVLLVDGQGRVIFANETGEALLRERDGLCYRGDRLAGATAADTRALQRLIAGAARTALGDGDEAGGVLALARPSGKRPLNALVSPSARDEFGLADGDAAAIVFVDDPERQARPREAVLMTLYRLTATEARLATALVGGATLKDYADEAAITLNTARWTLKQIFQKTETRSQSELIRLLLTTSLVSPS